MRVLLFPIYWRWYVANDFSPVCFLLKWSRKTLKICIYKECPLLNIYLPCFDNYFLLCFVSTRVFNWTSPNRFQFGHLNVTSLYSYVFVHRRREKGFKTQTTSEGCNTTEMFVAVHGMGPSPSTGSILHFLCSNITEFSSVLPKK